LIIAIDGPAGSGKSTIARRLAERLRLTYLDSGALYRALTYMCMRDGVDLGDVPAVVKFLEALDIDLQYAAGRQRVLANGRDITAEIRDPAVTRQVYYVAKEPAVRKEMVAHQRAFGKRGDLVAEGRDMGTVVFPNADFKFYLDAGADVRAQRRHRELREKGMEVPLEQLRKEIEQRDRTDMERKVAPLKRAEDATVVDTSDMTIDEVVEHVMERIEKGRK